ncbi:hypothetical protein ACIBEJ_24045 [Nonomuraea sp. NPDC050790]|uniref:hypothetical protein n=1 Tax=Nonomuraea sp. NPDC050790 TaxID=3364371 RepID=UPI00378B2BE7
MTGSRSRRPHQASGERALARPPTLPEQPGTVPPGDWFAENLQRLLDGLLPRTPGGAAPSEDLA